MRQEGTAVLVYQSKSTKTEIQSKDSKVTTLYLSNITNIYIIIYVYI